jgi:hypothetical protein
MNNDSGGKVVRTKERRSFPAQSPFKKNGGGVERSAFYWWWCCLRRNKDYLRCCERNGKGDLEGLYRDFGDVRSPDFRSWWYDTMVSGESRGVYLFARARAHAPIGFVKRIDDLSEWKDEYWRDGYLLLAVKMLEKRSAIRAQLERWLRDETTGPNYLSEAQRRERNRQRKAKGLKPMRMTLSAKRGRPSQLDSGARYRLSDAYDVTTLKDALTVYDFISDQRAKDAEEQRRRNSLLEIRAKIYFRKKRWKSLAKTEGGKYSENELRLFNEARELLRLDHIVAFQRDKESVKEDTLKKLNEIYRTRRRTKFGSFRKMGLSLKVWDNEKKLEQALDALSTQGKSLHKKVSRLYQIAERAIANTTLGEFPENSAYLRARKNRTLRRKV